MDRGRHGERHTFYGFDGCGGCESDSGCRYAYPEERVELLLPHLARDTVDERELGGESGA